MKDLDLAGLYAFATVARLRSYRKSALARGVAVSTLSEAVRRLEGQMGIRLLNRTTRSVTPTEAGAELLDHLLLTFSQLQTAVETVRSTHNEIAGTIRLNVPTPVARIILPPIVETFLLSNPDVAMEVVADDDLIDVLADGFDGGVRYLTKLPQDMIAIPIGAAQQRIVSVASPDFLNKYGRPSHPADISRFHCIRHRFHSGVIAPFSFERDAELFELDVSGQLVASTVQMYVQAAIAGLGIANGFEEDFREHLDSGAVEAVLPDWWRTIGGPYLYYPSRRHMRPAFRAFVDHVKTISQSR